MNNENPGIPPRNRLLLGGAIFVIGFAAPLLIPLVMASNLSSSWKTFLSGFLALGIPEIFMLIAAGILGKQGFAYIKSRLWRMIQPAEVVSLMRYRIGLVLFFLPILFIWLQPYLEQAQPEFSDKRVIMGLVSVGMVSISLFVLGGEFWDKLHGLFLYDAKVVEQVDQTLTKTATVQHPELPGSRLYIGGTLFGLSLFLPVFIPLLTYLPVSEEIRVVLGGLMVFGIPQVLMVLVITILGKPGFNYLKQRLGSVFKGLLASEVGRTRYRWGILFLLVPILMGIAWPYLTIVIESLSNYKIQLAVAGDVLLIMAVFLLGGRFWEKLISLFRQQSRVTVIN